MTSRHSPHVHVHVLPVLVWMLFTSVAAGWPFLAFDFVGLAAVLGSSGALITTGVAAWIAVKTSQNHTLAVETHAAVNSTATLLKSENLAEINVIKAERDALRAALDIANASSLAKAEGQLIQQSGPPAAPTPALPAVTPSVPSSPTAVAQPVTIVDQSKPIQVHVEKEGS